MLFTMIVSFLEVALHTCTEEMKRPNGRVHQVKPANPLRLMLAEPWVLPVWLGVASRLLLPVMSLLFTTTFWTVGLIASFYLNSQQDPNMTDCLSIELN